MDKRDIAIITRGVKRARLRVKDAARWLVAFAYKDFSMLSEREISSLGFDVAALALQEADDDVRRFFGPPFPELAAYLCFGPPDIKPGNLLATFQSEVKKRFEQAKRERRSWEFTPSEPRSISVRVFDVRGPEGQLLSDHTGRFYPQDDLMIIATKIVQREQGRFGICAREDCKDVFVMERKGRGKYCSPTCASYVNVNKARGKL